MKKYQFLLKDIPKKAFEYYCKNNEGKKSILIKYNYSKIIYIINNFIDVSKNIKRRRWDKKRKEFYEEEFSNTVYIYSRLMKGVDLNNQIISYYELNNKMVEKNFFSIY